MLCATTACTFWRSQLPRNAPSMRCFYHFDFETLLAPQWRTFSNNWLPKVLQEWCAFYVLTSTCASRHSGMNFFNISTSKSTPNLRRIMTSKCAWRHSRVQFLISPPTRWLCTHRFSEPTFRLSGATNWKNTMFGDISTFSHALIFLLLPLSLLTPSLLWPLSPLLLHLSISRKFDF